METSNIVIYATLSILGFFLKQTMDDNKQTKKDTNKNTLDIQVLKTDHDNKHQHMVEKFDMLNDNIKELTNNIKDLNEILNKK